MGVLDTWVVATVIAAHVPASVGEYRDTCHAEKMITLWIALKNSNKLRQLTTVSGFTRAPLLWWPCEVPRAV